MAAAMAVTEPPKFQVIFVLGGPGSGKGTQCARIVREFGYKHLSAGDLLRAERASGSELADMINGFINEGRLVPGEVTVNLLKQAMELEQPGSTFLIDGFPRSEDNLQCFQAILSAHCDVLFTLFFECPLETLEERLLARGATSGRSDDNLEVIQKRFRTFQEQSMPVVNLLSQQGTVHRISAAQPVDAVFEEVSRVLTAAKKAKVIFVLGGPGSGKGTQCAKIVKEFGYKHLSAGDLLRAERASGSELAEMINGYINEGKLVPGEVTVNLLKQAMEREAPGTTFLIDGFPRSEDNLACFQAILGGLVEVQFALFYECPLETLQQRLLARGETSGRSDDNIETIKKRFHTFQEQSMPVVNMLADRGLVRQILATPPPRVVFQETCRLMQGVALKSAVPFDATTALEESLVVLAPSVAVLHGDAIVGALEASGFEVVAQHRGKLAARLHRKLHLTNAMAHQCNTDVGGNNRCLALMVKRAGGASAVRRLFGMTPTGESSMLDLLGCAGSVHVSATATAAQNELAVLFPLEVPEPKRSVPSAASADQAETLSYLRDAVDPVIVPLFQNILQHRPTDVAGFVLGELRRMPPLVVFGPSGVGKGTLIAKLQEAFPECFGFSVSHTTRKPRSGEQDGVHYHFTSREEMQAAIDAGSFIEFADVFGNMYGTSYEGVSRVQSGGKICILDIDVQGVQRIKASQLDAKFVMVAPPSLDLLEARLRGRGTETEEKIQTRLSFAAGELEYGNRPGHADRIVVNDNLEAAVADLVATVQAWYPTLP